MDFTVLSHAGLRVRHEGVEVICDPWIVGSTYWRSWWNFPPPSHDLVESLDPRCIYLTHVHWDHFAGPSLRRFDKDTRIVIPLEPVGRMKRDLERMGFRNVTELGWGESHSVDGKITLTAYPFSVFTDSAVMIEAGGTTIFNCNDAKLMGKPLESILRNHPRIDFVLRSHSSANSRAVTHVIGSDEQHIDIRENYVDDFLAFAERSGAAHAIPFASNHCHLHPDVERFNSYVVSPDEVLERAESSPCSVHVQMLLPGDSWSNESGFVTLDRPEMEEKDRFIRALQDKERPKIDASMAREARATLSIPVMTDLVRKYFSVVPRMVRRHFKGHPILLVLTAGDVKHYVSLDIDSLTLELESEPNIDKYDLRIEAPLMVFMQCLALRLFSHLAISKRAHYFATQDELPRLRQLGLLFNFVEYEYFPLGNLLTTRFLRAWIARWREVILYATIAFNTVVRRKRFSYAEYLS